MKEKERRKRKKKKKKQLVQILGKVLANSGSGGGASLERGLFSGRIPGEGSRRADRNHLVALWGVWGGGGGGAWWEGWGEGVYAGLHSISAILV